MFKSTVMIKKLLGGFSLLLLLTSFGFAYFHTQSMSAQDMPMPGCPFMNDGVPVLCTMSPLEHIEAWQDMFTAVPVTFTLLLCLTLLVFFAPYLYSFKWSPPLRSRFRFTAPYTTSKPTFESYIQEAFSNGILNPKLF
jgi:hypothetical protein